MDLGLENKVALLTAASQGIGYAVAEGFAKEGARLMLTSRGEDNLRQACEQLEAQGATVHGFAGDVSDAASCQAMVQECVDRYGSLDVLFCNSGGPRSGMFDDLDAADYQRALDLNLLSVVHLCRAAIAPMKVQGEGRIIALTSMSVRQPVDGLLLSNTARAGTQGFLKTLSREVAPHGITVNNVLPGYTDTERLQELGKAAAERSGRTVEEVRASWTAEIPVGRLGKPEEVAALVVFLASRPAAFINGSAIAVDGGSVRGLL